MPGRFMHGFRLENIREVIDNLQRNSSFRYVNGNKLEPEYFEATSESLKDPHVYLVLSDTKSGASEIISVFTNKKYNHISISFDKNLQTVISYNGGMKISSPGLNRESKDILLDRANSSFRVYQLSTTPEQKKQMIDRIMKINEEGNAYNFAGIFTKKSAMPNIMFCSQFVYAILKDAGITFFDRKDTDVRPTDFVELDEGKKLEFLYEEMSANSGKMSGTAKAGNTPVTDGIANIANTMGSVYTTFAADR